MALQNRVLPTGEIIADPARGMFTGNRGCLHDDQRRLGPARWRGKAWIICALEWQGRQRQVMTPRTWTELFFMDEAVALAAGHRPCALCRRDAYIAFRGAWGGGARAVAMDAALHVARVDPSRGQRHFRSEISGLPDGVFILHEGHPHLIQRALGYPFQPTGYGSPITLPRGLVEVMTPKPTIAVLRAGYRPVLHPSAGKSRMASEGITIRL